MLADFEPHEDAERLVAAAADAVELLDAEGLEAAQRAVNVRNGTVAIHPRSGRGSNPPSGVMARRVGRAGVLHWAGQRQAARLSLRAATAEGSLPLFRRVRATLLVLVSRFFAAPRATSPSRKPATVSHATAVAREQAHVVRFARRFLGVPYRYGGTSPSSGFDCSGFTRFVYAHFGIVLPHCSGASSTSAAASRARRLRPGDLVFFDGLGHVGIYVGGGRFIHAPHTGTTRRDRAALAAGTRRGTTALAASL